ncbi:hypothetical protein VSS74_23420 [Conexibacter stalactiti]|uniref:Ribbon-helix-helix protein CopG domain-containing protein n=1 Tax=Conexibacter stalactiti TaxID=1940611 RepID=A0ABU4HVG7_9ACTN|nr:hypothetical protein [Conexibacter stalactiti]MDW5597317.1 hypothetical protein [Conexibacter stalactiti]MEC5037959.1 hypothetical protein [Conexibacter stalactiti]
MTAAGRRPRRVAITLRDSERDALAMLAQRAREPEATTAARLIRAALIDNGASLDAAVRRRTAAPNSSGDPDPDGAAGWLPPARRAAAIEELRERYPDELRYLRAGTLELPLVAEQAAALSVWREEIDAGKHLDPRMELAFANALEHFANRVQTHARRHR